MMGLIDRIMGREARGLENPKVPISSLEVVKVFGMDPTNPLPAITTDVALRVPAVFGAVNFLSGTMAGLPLHVYEKKPEGRVKVSGGLQDILHDAVNEQMSSFEWRKYIFERKFTDGRALTYIEWGGNGKVLNLWPMDPTKTTIRRRNGVKEYVLADGPRKKVYEASEVIDLPFYLKEDGLSHKSPLVTCGDVIQMALAMTNYGAKFFQGGGIPPYMLIGPFSTPAGLQRGAEEMKQAVERTAKEGKAFVAMPTGHELKSLGTDPQKSQMVEAHLHIIQQIARIYNLPPMFVQDLSNGTYTNSEQQDLHAVKWTLNMHVQQFEQECNLKFFGRGSRRYVEMNVDGLLRGDFKTRMEGYAQGIQNGVMTPNEVRARENMPDDPAGDSLYGQAQLVPLGTGMKQKGTDNAA